MHSASYGSAQECEDNPVAGNGYTKEISQKNKCSGHEEAVI